MGVALVGVALVGAALVGAALVAGGETRAGVAVWQPVSATASAAMAAGSSPRQIPYAATHGP